MRLLIGDPDQIGELLLGQPQHDPPLADPRADMAVDILGPARRAARRGAMAPRSRLAVAVHAARRGRAGSSLLLVSFRSDSTGPPNALLRPIGSGSTV